MHEGRMQTGRRMANAGSRLKHLTMREGSACKASLPAVTGENPRYGMIGGSRKRRHHSKPGPRLDPTQLPLPGMECARLATTPSQSDRQEAQANFFMQSTAGTVIGLLYLLISSRG
jgi:hypothetical protein